MKKAIVVFILLVLTVSLFAAAQNGKKDKELEEKVLSNTLTMADIADSAARASLFSKEDLLNAKAGL